MPTKSRSLDANQGDGVLFVERANELAICGKAKRKSGAEAKASVNSAISRIY